MPQYDPQTGTSLYPDPAWIANLPRFSAAAPPPPAGNWLTLGLASGFHGALADVGSAFQGLGTLTGIGSLQRGAQSFAQSQEAQAAASPGPENPWSLSGIGYQIAQAIPTIGGMIAAGALVPEEAVPAGLARVGATLPRFIGGGAGLGGDAAVAAGKSFGRNVLGASVAGLPLSVGQNVQTAEQGNKSTGAPLSRAQAAGAIGLGAVEAPLGGLLPAELKGGEVAGSLARSILKGAAVGAGTQATVGAVQAGLTQMMDPTLSTMDRVHGVVDAALSGGLVGGVLGGAFAPFHRAAQDPNLKDASNADLAAATDAGLNRQSAQPAEPTPQAEGYNDTPNEGLLSMWQPLADKGTKRSPEEETHFAVLSQEIVRRTQPGLAPGQGTLFTPEEVAARAPQVEALKAQVLKDTGPAAEKTPFIENFNAVDQPELINSIRAQAEAYGKKPPEWFVKLATDKGVMGPTPDERIVDLTRQADLSEQALTAANGEGKLSLIRATENARLDALIKLAEAKELAAQHRQADGLLPQPEVMPEEAPPLPKPTVDKTGQLNVPGVAALPAETAPAPAAEAAPSAEGQRELLTPEETGFAQQARQKAVQDFQDHVLADVPKRSLKTIGSALSKFDVTSEPELINALRDQVASGAPLDGGTLALANRYGVTDSAGQTRDLQAERDVLSKQYYDALVEAKASPGEGQQRALGQKATKLYRPQFEQLDKQIELNGQADDLGKAPPTIDVPDRVPDALRTQWADMEKIRTTSDNPKVVAAADNAKRAIETRVPEARQIVKNTKTANTKSENAKAKLAAAPPDAVSEPVAEAKPTPAEFFKEQSNLPPPVPAEAAKPKESIRVKKTLEPPDPEKLKEVFDREPQGSKMKTLLGRALNVWGSEAPIEERRKAVSNALTTYKNRPKDFTAFSSEVSAEPQSTDTDLAHLIAMGGTGEDVTSYLGDHSENPLTRAYAKFLNKIGVDTKISFGSDSKVDDDDSSRYGATRARYTLYTDGADEINVFSPRGLEQTLLHELTHSATAKALKSLTTPAAKEMQRLFDHVKGLGGGDDVYGLKNVHEFVSEAFSNSRFAEFLRGLNPETGSRLGNVWQALKNAAFKLLGMPGRMRSMFDQVMEVGHDVIDENTRIGSLADTTSQMMSAAQEAGAMRDQFFARRKLDDYLRDTSVGSESRLNRANKTWMYFAPMRTLLNDYGKLFKSKALELFHAAKVIHTTIGEKVSQVGYVVDQTRLKLDKRVADELNVVMRLATSHGFDPTKTWDQQPNLQNRDDKVALKKTVDDVQGSMSRIRQGGGLEAYHQMVAANQMGLFAEMYSRLARLKNSVFAEHQFSGYIGDPYEVFRNASELHGDPLGARDLWSGALRQELKGYDDVVKQLTGQLTSLPLTDKAGRGSIQAKLDPLNEVIKQASDQLQAMQESPYFHMGRTGHFYVAMKLAADPKDENKVNSKSMDALQDALVKGNFGDVVLNKGIDNRQAYIRVDTEGQMTALHGIAKQLESDGHVGEVSHGELTKSEDRKRVLSDVADRLISSVANSSNFDDATKAKVQSELEKIYADTLPDSRLVWRARENVQGASGDMFKSFLRRWQVTANAMANLGTADKVNDALGLMRADVEEAQRGDDPRKTLAMQAVQAEIQEREANRQWRPTHGVLDTLRSFVHAWYLGISPAYFALELSQMAIGAIPEMAKTHGYARATAAVANNLGMTIRVMRWVASGRFAKLAAPDALADAAKFGIPESTAKFILGMSNNGQLESSSFTHTVGAGAIDGIQQKIDRALHYANITALYTEVAMRVNVGLASRDLHNFRPFEGSGPYAAGLDGFVSKNVNEGLQDFSPSNAPRALGKHGLAGPLTPTLTQFSGWQLRMISKLYTEVHDLLSKGSSPQVRKEAGIFLAGHLGAVGILSGALGLPLLQNVLGAASNVANKLTGTEQYDFEQNFRSYLSTMFGNEFGDAVARGVPRLGGVDLSEFGDQSLMPFGEFLASQRKWDDAAKDASWHAMGSSVSFLANFMKSFNDFRMGDAIHGMQEAMPASAKGPYEAYLMSQYGYETRTGLKYDVQPTTADILKKAVGLEPANIKQLEDKQEEMENIQARREMVTSYLRGNLLRAYAHNDQPGTQAAVGNMMEYMQRNPGIVMNPGTTLLDQLRKQSLADALGTPPGVAPTDFGMRQLLAPYVGGGV